MPIKPKGSMGEMPMGDAAPETPEAVEEVTATLDMAIVGGQEVAAGDRIELEVVSVDPEMGSIVVKYPKAPAAPAAEEGIEEAAAAFDQPAPSY